MLMGLESAAARAMAISTVSKFSQTICMGLNGNVKESNTAGTGGLSSYRAWTVFLITMALCLVGFL